MSAVRDPVPVYEFVWAILDCGHRVRLRPGVRRAICARHGERDVASLAGPYVAPTPPDRALVYRVEVACPACGGPCAHEQARRISDARQVVVIKCNRPGCRRRWALQMEMFDAGR